ncbi:MAG TPA: alpha/beta fold hydrolase [Paralcaligenes sp.]
MPAQIDTSACPNPVWLPGRDWQTVYGALFAGYHRIAFVRDRVNTPDGDFLDFDWIGPGLFANMTAAGSKASPDIRLVQTAARRWAQDEDWDALPNIPDTPALVLFHGLEGSSKSHYAQAIAQYFRARGWIVAIAHFRGCSGFRNRMARAYHSGDSDDVSFIFDTVRKRAPHAKWYAVGVSLGGNAMLKYLGENTEIAQWLSASAAVSAPTDLVACGNRLSDSWIGRQLYTRYFLKAMKEKVFEKARRFPGTIDVLKLNQVRTLRQFDNLYTAPMHGYKNALDYWTRASSKPHLKALTVPTMVLNARNDPFIPEPSLPGSLDCSDQVLLHQPAEGGHCAFVTGPFPGHLNWLPTRLARFFETGR